MVLEIGPEHLQALLPQHTSRDGGAVGGVAEHHVAARAAGLAQQGAQIGVAGAVDQPPQLCLHMKQGSQLEYRV